MLHGNFQAVINNSSGGVNLTPYSGVIFFEVILTPKRSLRNSFSGVRTTPDLELIAGLPNARSARETEPHTHGIWSTSFRLVVT